ncbi:MAG TPA: thioredoxin [Bacillota bacterium]|nr:thioredoxin [Bacillota bacterium]HPE38359.1 thioredoxin [Bacillota bacterium]
MAVITISKSNFDTEVKKSETLVMVDFWASWCGPCRMLSPIVDTIADARNEIKVGKVNVDEEAELAKEFGIMSIPTLLFFKGGELVHKQIGSLPKEEIESLIDQLK